MPTGYTAPVEDGEITDLKTFALQCARAFGVAVEQRDEPMENPIRPLNFEDDGTVQYYSGVLQKSIDELRHLNSLNVKDRETEFQTYFAESEQRAMDAKIEYVNKVGRYSDMMDKVKCWDVSKYNSELLTNLKKFMIDQLNIGMPSDYSEYCKPKYKTAAEYVAGRMADANRSIERALESIQERKERIQKQNDALALLQKALDEAR
jgi:hypothetical protein